MNTQNSFYTFSCEPEQGTYSFEPHNPAFPRVIKARMAVEYEVFGRKITDLYNSWRVKSDSNSTTELRGIGQARCWLIDVAPNEQGLAFEITFAIPDHQPVLLWKVKINHAGSVPVRMKQIELLRTGGQPNQGRVVFQEVSRNLAFYSNGWQSWSYSAALSSIQQMPVTRLGRFQKPMINPGTPEVRQPGYMTSNFFGILADRAHRSGVLCGFLSQQQHFGSIEAVLFDVPSLRIWSNGDDALLEEGQTIETDWAVLFPFNIDQRDPLSPYLTAVAGWHGITPNEEIPAGWCSWYYYYTKVKANDILENLNKINQIEKELPLPLVQIDDGFERSPGDWLDFSPGFPDGVAPLAEAIQSTGKVAGLWLAPFIIHPKSNLYRNRPDWLLRDRSGKPVQAGFVWNTFPGALDLTHPEALDYTREVISTAAHQWGFTYLKLDFLYAAALKGQYKDPTKTRAQVLRQGMEALRDAAGPETYLLGCGLPLGSALGLVDAMRISADVGEAWKPQFFGVQFPFRQEWNMPSARNAIHNSLTRAFFHRHWWVNDPDCLLVRPDTKLTLAEVQALATVIGLTGGSVILSDDLPALPEERVRMAQILLPPIGERSWVTDWFDESTPKKVRQDFRGPQDEWYVLARFNWNDQPEQWSFNPSEFQLPDDSYWLHSFWDGQTWETQNRDDKPVMKVPPHGTVVLAVRKRDSGVTQYIGSDLHLSQGQEVKDWVETSSGVILHLKLNRRAKGTFQLAVPRKPVRILAGGEMGDWQESGAGRISVPVAFDEELEVRVDYTL